MKRLEGWESRLAQAIEAARHAPYLLGEHDCLRFSCRCIELITGVDFWPRFEGYKTKSQALVTILRLAPSLSEAVSLTLEQMPRMPVSARRGDLVRYRDVEDHLGICTGATVAVLGPDGLKFVGLRQMGIVECWRIG